MSDQEEEFNNEGRVDGGRVEERDSVTRNPGSCGNGISAAFHNFAAYYLKYTYREDDIPWAGCMIVLCLVLTAACFFFNGIVSSFYWKKRSEVVSLLYLLLSLADMAVCVGSCLTVASLLLYISLDMEHEEWDYVYPGMKYLCFFTFFISSIAIRVSIFLNVILTVVRAIMIKDPFGEINKMGLLAALAVFIFIWVVVSLGEVYAVKTLSIDEAWDAFVLEKQSKVDGNEDCADIVSEENRKQSLYMWYYIFTSMSGYYLTVNTINTGLPWSLNWVQSPDPDAAAGDGFDLDYLEIYTAYALMLVTFIVPTIIAVLCLVVQAVSLSRARIAGVENNNTQVTVTIILLTLVFVVCNTTTITFAVVCYYSDVVVEHPNNDYDSNLVVEDDSTIKNFYRLLFIFQQVLPLLNSTLNPMILIWRGSALRTYARSFCWENFSRLANARATTREETNNPKSRKSQK